jgi:hypothetical protein
MRHLLVGASLLLLALVATFSVASILQQHALTTPAGATGPVAHDQDKPPPGKPGEPGRSPLFRRASF